MTINEIFVVVISRMYCRTWNIADGRVCIHACIYIYTVKTPFTFSLGSSGFEHWIEEVPGLLFL
jgi:hypothetical protein